MKYDAILYVAEPVNESGDERYAPSRVPVGTDTAVSGQWNWDNPKLYANNAYGRSLQRSLNNMGNGFSASVTDFLKWVVVNVRHSNVITGRTCEKTFLVVFQDKGNGIIMNTANKYRTISGVDQAASYIKSACSGLASSAANKL